MIVKQIYSPDVYRKIMNAAKDKKDDIYRYELMRPFQGKWDCYHIPLKAAKEGGYDIIMANNRMGLLSPSKVDLTTKDWIEAISDRNLWDACQKSIETRWSALSIRESNSRFRSICFLSFWQTRRMLIRK